MIYLPRILKLCCRCGELKPATAEFFYSRRKKSDGLKSPCKVCAFKIRGSKRYQNQKYLPKGMRRCTECGSVLPATAEFFYKCAKRPSGLNSICKVCASKKLANWKAKNPKRTKVINKGWKDRNRDQVQEYNRGYRADNPQRSSMTYHRRAARKRGLPDDFKAEDWYACLEYWGNRCAFCGNPPGLLSDMYLCRDHFIPLSSLEGCPGTVPWNIVPACNGCNPSKGNRDPVEWLTEKLGPRKARKKLREIEAYFESVRR